jgi:hypothetical protein
MGASQEEALAALHARTAGITAYRRGAVVFRTTYKGETNMTQQVSIGTGLITEASDSRADSRPFVLWPLILVAAIVAVVALAADASLTPDQRIAVSLQSGMYP